MTGKRGVPLLEVLVVVSVLIALCVFAGRQYKVARVKGDAIVLGQSLIRCTTWGTRFVHVDVSYTDFSDGDFDMLDPVGPFEDFNAGFSFVTPPGLLQLPYPSDIQALTLTAMELEDKDLDVLSRFSNLQKLDLKATFITDAGLPQLSRLKNLRSLSLQQCRITNEGVAQLRNLNQLQTLNVAFTDVTAEGLSAIDGFKSLTKVVMWPRPRPADSDWPFEVEVTRKLANSRGMDRIKQPDRRKPSYAEWSRLALPKDVVKRFPSLRALTSRTNHIQLAGTLFNDSDAGVLSHYPFLNGLNLDDTNIGDATLRELSHHWYMQYLSIASTNVTDAGMEVVSRLPLLSSLDLRNTRVTDVGLLKLRRLHQLNAIVVVGSLVTDSGIARLKSHFPDLQVMTHP